MRRLAFLKRPKVFIPLLIIILLVIAVVLAVRNLTAPAVGTINQTPMPKAEITDPYASTGKYSSKYLSFTYPAHYKKIPAAKSGNYLEVADFYATDHSGKQISVGLIKESIGSDSGIAYRKAHPELYRQEPRTRLGAVVFSKLTGDERTAYIAERDRVVSVSVTAPTNMDLTADCQTVLNSLIFK